MKRRDDAIDPPCPVPFTPEASGIDPNEIKEEEMTDKPFPTPDEFHKWIALIGWGGKGDECDKAVEAYNALHAAYKAIKEDRNLWKETEATCNRMYNELQQQLEAIVEQRIEQSKRIAKLEKENCLLKMIYQKVE